MIIDHIGLGVGDYGASRDFFVRALAPLGIELVGGAGVGGVRRLIRVAKVKILDATWAGRVVSRARKCAPVAQLDRASVSEEVEQRVRNGRIILKDQAVGTGRFEALPAE